MAQIIVRQLPDAVHSALKSRAQRDGKSAESLAREILTEALLPEGRPRLGDQLAEIWRGADLGDVEFPRDKTVYRPPEIE